MTTSTYATAFTFEVSLTTEKNGRLGKVNGQKIHFFLERARDGACMSYKDFLSPSPYFTGNDFYVIVNMIMEIGLATKEGSKYRFETGFKARFREFLNENLLALSF